MGLVLACTDNGGGGDDTSDTTTTTTTVTVTMRSWHWEGCYSYTDDQGKVVGYIYPSGDGTSENGSASCPIVYQGHPLVSCKITDEKTWTETRTK